jgi:general secretion pathway protein K
VRRDSGFALIVTLLVTALLVALSVEFTTEVFVDTSARHTYVAGQQSSLLAESGITGGIRLLQHTRDNQSYSSLSDQWAQPLTLSDERGELRLTIEEESGKLNLNGFPPNGELAGNFPAEVAGRLFRIVKLDSVSDLVDALADWCDENDYPHPGGAESRYYNSLKPPYASKNRSMDSVEELALVKGFAGEPARRLLPLVTVYQDLGMVNINTAPREIIQALDERISENMAKRVLEYRTSTPFRNSAELAKVPGFETIAAGLLGKITVRGNIYRLRAEGRVQDVSRTIEAVVRLGGARPQTVYWREYEPF